MKSFEKKSLIEFMITTITILTISISTITLSI